MIEFVRIEKTISETLIKTLIKINVSTDKLYKKKKKIRIHKYFRIHYE